MTNYFILTKELNGTKEGLTGNVNISIEYNKNELEIIISKCSSLILWPAGNICC